MDIVEKNGGAGIADQGTAEGRPADGLTAEGRAADGWTADAGMATAEYAIATLAACGFAGLLVTILRGDEVQGMLLNIVRQALSLG